MSAKAVLGVLLTAWVTFKLVSYCSDHELESDELRGKNILLTGASSGIGEQMAYVYAKHGANVFITARREHRLKEVVKKCASIAPDGARFAYFPADMEKDEDRERLVQRTTEFFEGDLDQLMLNHAIVVLAKPWSASPDDVTSVRKTLEVNTVAFAHLTALVYPHLVAKNGTIGVVSSIAGRLPVAYMPYYASSKFALDGYFSSLRAEFRNRQIPVSITLAFLGAIGTDQAIKDIKRLTEIGSSSSLEGVTLANVENTAAAVISATTRKQSELYYPMSQFLRPIVIIRHVFPGLLDMVM